MGRRQRTFCLVIAGCLFGTGALADHAPAWVIPNPRGIPLVVDGVEVSGAVIEGDWGLYRPGHGTVTIYGGAPLIEPEPGHYFPHTGRRPRLGRQEVETPQDRRPRRAQPYSRSWTADSSDVSPESNAPGYPSDYPPWAFEVTPEVHEAWPDRRFKRRNPPQRPPRGR